VREAALLPQVREAALLLLLLLPQVQEAREAALLPQVWEAALREDAATVEHASCSRGA
jgi:hypothetical protein